MNWTIRNKLFGLSAVGLLLITVVGAAGYIGTTRVDGAMDEIVTMNGVLRNHLGADMMHDALRGDVLAALLAGEGGDRGEQEKIRADLREHSENIRNSVAANKELATNKTIRDALENADADLEAYVLSAEAIVSLAFRDRAAAQEQFGGFLQAFGDLEGRMEAISDKVEEVAGETQVMGDAAVKTATATIIAFGLGAFIVLALLALIVTRSITTPLYQTIAVLSAIAAGDLTQDLKLERKDEIGDVFNAIRQMKTNLVNIIASIAETSTSVANSSEELSAVSSQMSSGAEETSNQANVVSAAAEQVNKNLQSVSTGAEEMMASIKEIAKNSNEAASVAASAVKVAENTNATIAKLGDSSVEIGQVIKVITSIAQQTNLLALNATIEAARAGEAGKGFAVVANEVKELAKETAKATEEISQKIEAIQGDSKESVDAIAQITTIIAQINDISNTIAASVEEQTATSTEMGRNVGEAAKGSAEIADNISGVAKAAQDTSGGANNTMAATTELSRMAVELQQIVNQFKIEEGANGNARPSSRRFQQGTGRQHSLLGVNADAGSSSEVAARRQDHEELVHTR